MALPIAVAAIPIFGSPLKWLGISSGHREATVIWRALTSITAFHLWRDQPSVIHQESRIDLVNKTGGTVMIDRTSTIDMRDTKGENFPAEDRDKSFRNNNLTTTASAGDPVTYTPR
jgi:hypothetical protein